MILWMIFKVMIIETEFVRLCKQWLYEWSSRLWLLSLRLYRGVNIDVINDRQDYNYWEWVCTTELAMTLWMIIIKVLYAIWAIVKMKAEKKTCRLLWYWWSALSIYMKEQLFIVSINATFKRTISVMDIMFYW